MKNKLIGYLAAKGVTLPMDASEDTVIGAIDSAIRNGGTKSQAQTASPNSPGGYVEPLLGCDPATVSPARAGSVFAQFAKKICTDEGCDLAVAWQKAKLLKPELHARMLAGDDDANAAALANAGTPQPPIKTVLASSKPFVAGAFHLPPTVPDDLLNAAYTANGGQSAKVDAAKVFIAVQMFLAKRDKLTADLARRQVIMDYPELALFAKQVPSPTPTTTGGFGAQS